MIISDKHLFLTASSDMNEIISPLNKYNIIYFTYNKNYTDGTRIRLTTHANHLKVFLENEYFRTGNIDANPQLYLNQAILFSTLKNQALVEWLRNDFGIENGIYIVRKSELFTEFFSFAASLNNSQIVNFYLNNLDFMQNFCDYFKEKAKFLIAKAEQNKLIHDYHQKDIQVNPIVSKTELPYIPTKIDKIITPRKKEIINFVLKGYSAKEIAKILDLSHRTIETYINELKIKFDARNIVELVVKLMEMSKNSNFFT